ASVPAVRVLERGIQTDADAVRGVRPLPLEVLGRGNHSNPVDGSTGEQLGGDPESERGLASPRCRRREEVAGSGAEVEVEGLLLPGSKLARGAAGRSLRKRRREMF